MATEYYPWEETWIDLEDHALGDTKVVAQLLRGVTSKYWAMYRTHLDWHSMYPDLVDAYTIDSTTTTFTDIVWGPPDEAIRTDQHWSRNTPLVWCGGWSFLKVAAEASRSEGSDFWQWDDPHIDGEQKYKLHTEFMSLISGTQIGTGGGLGRPFRCAADWKHTVEVMRETIDDLFLQFSGTRSVTITQTSHTAEKIRTTPYPNYFSNSTPVDSPNGVDYERSTTNHSGWTYDSLNTARYNGAVIPEGGTDTPRWTRHTMTSGYATGLPDAMQPNTTFTFVNGASTNPPTWIYPEIRVRPDGYPTNEEDYDYWQRENGYGPAFSTLPLWKDWQWTGFPDVSVISNGTDTTIRGESLQVIASLNYDQHTSHGGPPVYICADNSVWIDNGIEFFYLDGTWRVVDVFEISHSGTWSGGNLDVPIKIVYQGNPKASTIEMSVVGGGLNWSKSLSGAYVPQTEENETITYSGTPITVTATLEIVDGDSVICTSATTNWQSFCSAEEVDRLSREWCTTTYIEYNPPNTTDHFVADLFITDRPLGEQFQIYGLDITGHPLDGPNATLAIW